MWPLNKHQQATMFHLNASMWTHMNGGERKPYVGWHPSTDVKSSKNSLAQTPGSHVPCHQQGAWGRAFTRLSHPAEANRFSGRETPFAEIRDPWGAAGAQDTASAPAACAPSTWDPRDVNNTSFTSGRLPSFVVPQSLTCNRSGTGPFLVSNVHATAS